MLFTKTGVKNQSRCPSGSST